jgi:hypothetical protein
LAIDGGVRRPYARSEEASMMVRHVAHWLDLLEAIAIVVVLLAIAWLSWMAISTAYAPVMHLLRGL